MNAYTKTKQKIPGGILFGNLSGIILWQDMPERIKNARWDKHTNHAMCLSSYI